MSRFPGHLRAKRQIAEVAFFLLMDEYDGYKPFVDDCKLVKAQRAAALSSPDFSERLTRPRELVEHLALRWNLDRISEMRVHNFAPLERALERVGTRIDDIEYGPFRPISPVIIGSEPQLPSITYGDRQWTWRLTTHENLARLRGRIVEDLGLTNPDQLPAEIIEQLRELPDKARSMGVEIGDIQHSLRKHVRWLFLRLCPQPVRPLGYKRIAALEGPEFVAESTIRRTVSSLANQMGIELPALSPGRPRRARP